MLKYDKDFGGIAEASEICQKFGISRKIYDDYKKKALIIRKCYKEFGGTMIGWQAMAAAGIADYTTFGVYVKYIKEGLNDPE